MYCSVVLTAITQQLNNEQYQFEGVKLKGSLYLKQLTIVMSYETGEKGTKVRLMEEYAVESKILVQQRGANLKQCPIQAAGATLQPTIISNITRIQQGFKFTSWLPWPVFFIVAH